ncbi:hypothetical protein [Gemmatimonas sp.]
MRLTVFQHFPDIPAARRRIRLGIPFGIPSVLAENTMRLMGKVVVITGAAAGER